MLSLNCWVFSHSAFLPRAVGVLNNIVISGFNTDIEFDGVVYHVQTEDKGMNAHMIMTLVYNGGTILASKRSPYDDLITDNFDETVVADRLGRQHKLICAAVRAGRMEDLKKMTRKAALSAAGVAPETPRIKTEKTPAFVPVDLPATIAETPIAAPAGVPITVGQEESQRIISVSSPSEIEIQSETEKADLPPIEIPAASLTFKDKLNLEEEKTAEEEIFLDLGAVEVVSELSGMERPINEKLSLELLGESIFKGGDRATVNIMVCRGTARKVVGSAQIMIKVLGSTFRPIIFHAKTDTNGLATVHMQLPHFRAGRAALLVRAMTDGEEIELRRIVTPG